MDFERFDLGGDMTFVRTTFFAIYGLATSALAEPTSSVFIPSGAEMDLIVEHLSKEMLDPESTIVSDVVAARKTVGGDNMAWVCGKVRGRNGFGGYSQPLPFMGALLEQTDGSPDFILIGISDQSPSDQAHTQATCLEHILD